MLAAYPDMTPPPDPVMGVPLDVCFSEPHQFNPPHPSSPPPPLIRLVPANPRTHNPKTFGEWDSVLKCKWLNGGKGCKRVHAMHLPGVALKDPTTGLPIYPALVLEDTAGGIVLDQIDGSSAELRRSKDDPSLWTFKLKLCTKTRVRIRSVHDSSGTAPIVCSEWFRVIAKSPSTQRSAASRQKANRKREWDERNGAHLPRVPPRLRTCPPKNAVG